MKTQTRKGFKPTVTISWSQLTGRVVRVSPIEHPNYAALKHRIAKLAYLSASASASA